MKIVTIICLSLITSMMTFDQLRYLSDNKIVRKGPCRDGSYPKCVDGLCPVMKLSCMDKSKPLCADNSVATLPKPLCYDNYEPKCFDGASPDSTTNLCSDCSRPICSDGKDPKPPMYTPCPKKEIPTCINVKKRPNPFSMKCEDGILAKCKPSDISAKPQPPYCADNTRPTCADKPDYIVIFPICADGKIAACPK